MDDFGKIDTVCPRCGALQSEVAHLRGLVGELQDRLMSLIPDAMQAFHKTQQTTYAPGASGSEVVIGSTEGEEQVINVEDEILGH